MKEEHFYGQVTQKALIEREGKFLFQQRSKESSMAGLWDLPGGRLNEGEDPHGGLRREVFEELGVDIHIGNPMATGVFTNRSHAPTFLVVYQSLLVHPDVAFLFESNVERAEWYSIEEALQLPMIYEVYTNFLKDIQNKISTSKF